MKSEFDYIPKELDVGTIVYIYKPGVAYLLEFMNKKGETVGLVDMFMKPANVWTKNCLWT